jgi:hypothetical protein
MVRFPPSAVAALSVYLLVSPGNAEAPPPAAAPPHVKINAIAARREDVGSIDGIVKAYYDVISGPEGQPRQWDRDHTLYIPDMRFVVFAESKDGSTTVRSMTHQQFAEALEAAVGKSAFYEREVHRIVHRFGNVAHVLSTGEQRSSPGGPATGHSLDSLELFWDGQRWWIASASIWPGERVGRPLTAEFLEPSAQPAQPKP